MSRARSPRLLATILLGGASGLMGGCTHYHYYGQAAPICDPGTTLAPVATAPAVIAPRGSICEVPGSSGTVVAARPAPSRSEIVVSSPQPSRGRLSWRRPDPESLATTRIQGHISDSQVR